MWWFKSDKAARAPSKKDVEIHLRYADLNTYRDVLKESKTKEIRNLIVEPSSIANVAMLQCCLGLIKLRELVRAPSKRDVEIHLRQADPDTYRAVLKEIKTKEIHNLIVDTKPEHMHHFLRGVSVIENTC